MTQRSRKQERLLRWKIVLDTNVFVSALGWGGDALRVLDLWKTGSIQIVVSNEIVDEYLDVLGRWMPPSSLEYWRLWFSHPTKVTQVHSYTKRFELSRDATDNKFIDAAVAGGAGFVVTRDKDLLSLGEFREIQFVEPKRFLAEFRSAERS